MQTELCYLVVRAVGFSAGGGKVLSLAAGGVCKSFLAAELSNSHRFSNSCARYSHTSSSFYSQYSAEQPYLHLSIMVVLIYIALYISLTSLFVACLLKICQRPWAGLCKMRPELSIAGLFMCKRHSRGLVVGLLCLFFWEGLNNEQK